MKKARAGGGPSLSIDTEEVHLQGAAAGHDDELLEGELALGVLTGKKAPPRLVVDLGTALEAGADSTPPPQGEFALGALSEGFFEEADTNHGAPAPPPPAPAAAGPRRLWALPVVLPADAARRLTARLTACAPPLQTAL